MACRTGYIKGGLPLEDRSQVAREIRKFRLSRGWTQAEMGKSVGLPVGHIGILESFPKYKGERVTLMQYMRFRDSGLDLKAQIKNLIVSDTHKGKRAKYVDPDFSVKSKGNVFHDSISKAMALVNKAKLELQIEVVEIDKQIIRHEKDAELQMQAADELRAKKEKLLKRIHKAELGVDHIGMSLVQTEEKDEVQTTDRPDVLGDGRPSSSISDQRPSEACDSPFGARSESTGVGSGGEGSSAS